MEININLKKQIIQWIHLLKGDYLLCLHVDKIRLLIIFSVELPY
jgi:hypothetical protein